MTTEKTSIEITPGNLQMQIEGFSNFDRELVPGASVKKMMGEQLKAPSSDLYKVKPQDITVLPGYNPRVHNRAYFEGIEELSDSMMKHGYYADKPLACFIARLDGEDRLVLQDGHRRHAAVLRAIEKGAPIKTVPVVLKERSDNAVDLTLALLHSNEGAPFSTYEKAVLAKRLKKMGWENKQIAEEFHCTAAAVGQLLTMAGAPQAIAELVQNGNLSATEMHRLILQHGAEEATRMATEGMGRAKAEGRAKITAKDLSPADLKAKNAKKYGYEMYRLLKGLRDDPAIEKKMSDKQIEQVDAIIADIEKKPKAPKEPKAAKTPKAAAAKKAPKAAKSTVPMAKKIADASKKGNQIEVKGSDKSGRGNEGLLKKITDLGQGATARRNAVGQRRSER